MSNENGPHDHKYIVGIGASAGGLEALQKLFTALAPDTGFPYIVVQHLSPDYKSMLVHILGKYTSMPVAEAQDGAEIFGDHVYIIQPGKLMTISDGRLHLTDMVTREFNLPIDTFFYSLAQEAGPRAVAIVLSGTGSDGSNGIKAVKERDGLVIAQDLDSCKFDGMPRSAMRTGLVDAQIAPEEIALELKYISCASTASRDEGSRCEADADTMDRAYSALKKVSNINFAHYKQAAIVRRMERRMMLTHREALPDYIDFLCASPDEARLLSREILIGVTGFFRDPELFQTLKEKAIPDILNRSTPDEPIRVWVAGCSTGEEAYSIAILFSEVMRETKIKRVVKIFATDIDTDAIETAGKGVYGENIMQSVTPARLSRYFTRKNSTYVVNRNIRWMIVFSAHNVMQDPPFGKLDLISCRNMLVYFQPVQQNTLFSIFHRSLKDGAFLFLGKSETTGAYTEAFPVVDQAAKIFAHRRNVKIAGEQKSALTRFMYVGDGNVPPEQALPGQRLSEADEENEQRAVNDQLLKRFMPSGIVVNGKNELVRTYGDNANFIHLSTGKFSNSLFDILTNGLMIPVSTLLKEARAINAEASYSDIRFKGEKSDCAIDLIITPVGTDRDGETGSFAIVFEEHRQGGVSGKHEAYDVDKAAARRIADLEQEMSQLKTRLDRSSAEQECVNTELQAANEELLTANEELQSSNEELQSVNEELYTVNTEYQQKLGELNNLNDDIANFLSSSLTGIIFVDEKLNIRRYTDYMTSEFSVMEQDVGRPVSVLAYHFPSINLSQICSNVLSSLAADEREVVTSRGRAFFMRISPYRSTENKIMGCVITLMDITNQKQGQQTLLNTEKQLTMAQQTIDAKSDYLIRVAARLHTPIGALMSLASGAKKLAGDNGELRGELGKIEENVDYISEVISNMSRLTMGERLVAESGVKPLPASVAGEVIACVSQSGGEEPRDKREYDLAGRKVLLAEDNALNRTVIETMLTNEGLTCVEAADGDEAVSAYLNAGEHEFSCVLMDIKMPKLDGVSAAAGIRASGRSDAKTIPIIGILTKGFDDGVNAADDRVMDATITKPVEKQELFELMGKLIKR